MGTHSLHVLVSRFFLRKSLLPPSAVEYVYSDALRLAARLGAQCCLLANLTPDDGCAKSSVAAMNACAGCIVRDLAGKSAESGASTVADRPTANLGTLVVLLCAYSTARAELIDALQSRRLAETAICAHIADTSRC
jgi:hypothetical protein